MACTVWLTDLAFSGPLPLVAVGRTLKQFLVIVTRVEFKKQKLAAARSSTDFPLPAFLGWAMVFWLPSQWALAVFY